MASHYRQIDGVKYSKELLDLADELVAGKGDGRISVADAERIFATLEGDGKYSDLEKRTVSYIRQNYNQTEAADTYLRGAIRSWAASKGNDE